MASTDIKVPNIGDFSEVTVIELMVKPGDTVAVDQSLITVESDKASMEIPSSHAGVVKSLKVALGDTVNQGSLLLMLEADGDNLGLVRAGFEWIDLAGHYSPRSACPAPIQNCSAWSFEFAISSIAVAAASAATATRASAAASLRAAISAIAAAASGAGAMSSVPSNLKHSISSSSRAISSKFSTA